jgi:hypothetical protein
MEKFKIYSNDPYDFNDYAQIEEFYKLIKNQTVLNKISDENKDKIYLKIVTDKKEDLVEVSLIQSRKNETARIKLPDLVLDYQEFKIKDADKFIDLTEYMEFD